MKPLDFPGLTAVIREHRRSLEKARKAKARALRRIDAAKTELEAAYQALHEANDAILGLTEHLCGLGVRKP